MKKKLEDFPVKTISLEQLIELSGEADYLKFTELIAQHRKEGFLNPVKASGLNGRRPALYNKYRIEKPQQDFSKAFQEIKILHPKFDHAKYSANPVAYLKDKREIDELSKFLWSKEHLLEEQISINERSFQIWGAEKILKDSIVINRIFKFNGWNIEDLNFYETPEPFFEYQYETAPQMNVLILENKDTWYSLRKIMREEHVNELYRPYHVLLYGEGKKITDIYNRLSEFEQIHASSNYSYYYFGDLDYEGIAIYESLVAKNSNLNISICTELYSAMLIESKHYELPFTKKGQVRIDTQQFTSLFNEGEAQVITEILKQGRYIPQEILNYSWMKSKMIQDRRN